MYLASCGYWGGNPEHILNAPASLVLGAFEFSIRKENMKWDKILEIFSQIMDGIASGFKRGAR